jgi:RecG-like helicase
MSGAAAPPRDSPSAAEPAAPVAFATTERQGRERLASAPLRSAPRPSLLRASLTTLRGAGPRLAAAAVELGIETLRDLLEWVPHSYRERDEPRQLGELKLGEHATVLVEVRSARLRPTRRRGLTIVEATVADASGPGKAVWFNQPWLAERLREGTRMLLYGKLDRSGLRVEAHEFAEGNGATGIHTTGFVPVHPASERLRAQRIRDWARR